MLAVHLTRLFKKLRINCVLDVGARTGDYAVWLRQNGFRGRIVSFEPVSDSFAVLERRSRRDPQWSAYRLAIGASDGEGDINVTREPSFSSFLQPNSLSRSEFQEDALVERHERVPVRRLDGIFDEVTSDLLEERVYLKMDTQGWDLQVLDGAAGCRDKIAALQTEVAVRPIYEDMPTLIEALSNLERLGFSLSGLFAVNLDSRMAAIELDCVAVNGVS